MINTIEPIILLLYLITATNPAIAADSNNKNLIGAYNNIFVIVFKGCFDPLLNCK